MKKEHVDETEDELRPEYDLSTLKNRVRGKYAESYKAGTNLVLLEPDVAQAFPDSESVNKALRVLLDAKLSALLVDVARRLGDAQAAGGETPRLPEAAKSSGEAERDVSR
ncbi:MAG TPA: hypothetical protein VGB98_20720 [Pyrinomonadaceae bacterium]|jgi:hypothetical protein